MISWNVSCISSADVGRRFSRSHLDREDSDVEGTWYMDVGVVESWSLNAKRAHGVVEGISKR